MGRSLRAAFLLVCASGAAPVMSYAADYPDHQVHLVTGAAAGGGGDFITRLIAQKLADRLGQPFVVDNRAGASETIAADFVAHAPADGYTLLMASATQTIPNEFKLNYDPVSSFAPIILVAEQPELILVNPSVPANSLQELIALAKANPSGLNFGDGGTGTPTFMTMELFMSRTGITLTHVAYKAAAPAQVGLLGGEVQVMVGAVSSNYDLVKSGKEKALAYSTSARMPKMPDVPTIEEAIGLKGFDVPGWYGLMAPAGTPPAVVGKLNAAVAEIIASPEVTKILADQTYVAVGDKPDEFGAYLRNDAAKWTDLVKTMHIN